MLLSTLALSQAREILGNKLRSGSGYLVSESTSLLCILR